MLLNLVTLVSFCLSALAASPAPAPDNDYLIIAHPKVSQTFSLKDLKEKLAIFTITIDDPVYKKKKSFDGFLLTDVLKLLGPMPQDADELIFRSRDGYSPSLPLTKAQAQRAIIAFREHGAGPAWEKVQQGKAWVSPAPYYLVWEAGAALGNTYPWPYQLVKIEVVSFKEKYPKVFPDKAKRDSAVMRGFVHFKTECMTCHSINLQGGDLGPELNIPKNITEYWDKDVLKQFIRNASSFREKSKMPKFTDKLTESDVAEIVEYLEHMKGLKQLVR